MIDSPFLHCWLSSTYIHVRQSWLPTVLNEKLKFSCIKEAQTTQAYIHTYAIVCSKQSHILLHTNIRICVDKCLKLQFRAYFCENFAHIAALFSIRFRLAFLQFEYLLHNFAATVFFLQCSNAATSLVFAIFFASLNRSVCEQWRQQSVTSKASSPTSLTHMSIHFSICMHYINVCVCECFCVANCIRKRLSFANVLTFFCPSLCAPFLHTHTHRHIYTHTCLRPR